MWHSLTFRMLNGTIYFEATNYNRVYQEYWQPTTKLIPCLRPTPCISFLKNMPQKSHYQFWDCRWKRQLYSAAIWKLTFTQVLVFAIVAKEQQKGAVTSGRKYLSAVSVGFEWSGILAGIWISQYVIVLQCFTSQNVLWLWYSALRCRPTDSWVKSERISQWIRSVFDGASSIQSCRTSTNRRQLFRRLLEQVVATSLVTQAGTLHGYQWNRLDMHVTQSIQASVSLV